MTEIPPSPLVVVVVDDDVFERMGASGMFLDAGYRVLEAGDADEALQLFEANAGHQAAFHGRQHARLDERVRLGLSCRRAMARVGIIMTSGRPRPPLLPLSMLFHDKPYEPAAVLRQAREMTATLG